MKNVNEQVIAKLLISSSPEGVLVADDSGEILLVNRSLLNMFGYASEEELIGEKVEILIPGKYVRDHKQFRNSFVRHPSKRKMGLGKTLYGRRKDGSDFPVEIGLNFVKHEGEMMVSALITDITERIRIEDELKELNSRLEKKVAERTLDLEQAILELQETNHDLEEQYRRTKKAEAEMQKALEAEKQLGELKSRFVSMASHEFRTPLSTILSSNTLIQKYLEKDDIPRDKISNHTIKIHQNIQNLNNILNDLLSLSKLEEGKVEINYRTFGLTELIGEVNEEMTDYLKEGQTIHWDIEQKDMQVYLDRQVLHNMLLNLISNASKYSEGNSVITVGAGKKNNAVWITVTDQGIGIPEEEKKHMFDRFFRAKNALNIEGTGLGLNIVKKYAELMNGNISFESELNKGTTFTLRFETKQ